MKLATLLDTLSFQEIEEGLFSCNWGKGSVIKCNTFSNALSFQGITTESFRNVGLKFTRRTVDDGYLYFLVNHTAKNIDTTVSLNSKNESVLFLDPQTGDYGITETDGDGDRTEIRVQLASGEALFLKTLDLDIPDIKPWKYKEVTGDPILITGKWTLQFEEGGQSIPPPLSLDELLPWTALGNTLLDNFSGTGRYSIDFRADDPVSEHYLLDLGNVYESAEVWINGKVLGICYSNPFVIPVSGLIRSGNNKLEIEVANLMANRIRHMDREGIPWKKFHDINFVNIRYEPFDASDWDTMTSGLEGPVRLIPVELR
jgi:hypothetical protein